MVKKVMAAMREDEVADAGGERAWALGRDGG